VCLYPLDELSFSTCGRYIHGLSLDHKLKGQRVMFNISEEIQKWGQPDEGSSRALALAQLDSTGPDALSRAGNPMDQIGRLAVEEMPGSIMENAIVFGRSKGSAQISVLKQYHKEGAVVLQSLKEDGTTQTEHITRLPKSSTLETSYATLLEPFDNSESIRLILNKRAQDSYSCEERPDFSLPALLTRQKESIPSWIGKRPALSLEGEETQGKRKLRKHLTIKANPEI
jgi:hypothetical protein